jgi:hypothetical protein
MSDKQSVVQAVRDAFGSNQYPGDACLQGSTEGCEPYDEVGPFQGKTDWQKLDAAFLDARAAALSFFSEAGFRFFLPAYLTADLHDQLKLADPVFSLTGGFSDVDVETSVGNRLFVIKSGKSDLINPRRYGAATLEDYARYRLSVFTREEAVAIVAYLEYQRDSDAHGTHRAAMDVALNEFWCVPSRTAPTAANLQVHPQRRAEFVAAVRETNDIR